MTKIDGDAAKDRCDRIVIEWNEIDRNRQNRIDLVEIKMLYNFQEIREIRPNVKGLYFY